MINEEITDEALRDITGMIKTLYGHDFSGYAVASLKRRIARFASVSRVDVADLRYHITNDQAFFYWMLESLTVNVTEMFRDPDFYKSLREHVIPVLATYPHIKIWHAGCATGEEAYSVAIMLHEAGILNRCRIYATDMSLVSIERASTGIIPLERMKEYTANYMLAGGPADFSNYYTARYQNAIINKELRKNIHFSQHNLVTDHVFNEFQLICCRNVLIYFKRELQSKVIDLFCQSLSPLGYLALGTKESLTFTDAAGKFETIDLKNRIFRLNK